MSQKMHINKVKFKDVPISESEPICGDLDDSCCMFCKKTLCECSDVTTYGYVRLELDDCKTIGSLANLRRDRMSKWEKEAKDKEYADSSRLAAKKLEQEKRGPNPLEMSQEQRAKVFSSPEAQQRYIRTGEW